MARAKVASQTPVEILPGDDHDERDDDLIREVRLITLKEMAARLKQAEVEVPETWRGFCEAGVMYPGECYYRGYRFLQEICKGPDTPFHRMSTDLWLVHGMVMYEHDHCWVELPGEVIFDGTLQRFYSRQDYYQKVPAIPLYRYTWGAASVISFNIPLHPDGTFDIGGWDQYLELPPGEPDNPFTVDRSMALELVRKTGLYARCRLDMLGRTAVGVWMTVTEWTKYMVRKRLTHVFVPEEKRKTAAGRTESVASVFEATLNIPLVTEFRGSRITLRLERDSTDETEPRYRFVEINRKRLSAG